VTPADTPALTASQKRLLRESFESAQEYSNALTKLFYGRLFELAPATRPLFKTSIEEQSFKLLNMLAAIIDALDRFEELRPMMFELGHKHVAYGARPEHYQILRKALLWALAQALEAEFDRETKAAWDQMLRAIEDVMLAGASASPPTDELTAL
jgi:hemoglobin-like flavoprotein